MQMSDSHFQIFPDAIHARIERDLQIRNGQTSYQGTPLSYSEKPGTGSWDVDIGDFPTVGPALKPATQLWLTIVYISLYGLLFLFVYCQLWMIWYYQHKRFSYQTVFLFLCLIWTGLRTTLFSFYFNDCMLANNLALFFSWLLYCFPVCLQFVTLCLLVFFFAQVVFKARARYEPSRYKTPLRIVLSLVVFIFMATNISCAVVVRQQEKEHHSVPLVVLIIRVSINDTLFLLAAVVLSLCIYKMRKMSSSHVILEAKGTTLCQALTVSISTIFLFASRALYNIIAILPSLKNMPNFGYSWINVSDQADIVDLDSGYAYLSFGIVLFVWEVLPTLVIILFFRVKKPQTNMALTDLSTHSQTSRQYFFDNPRRYDSDDDLARGDISRSINDINFSYQSINNSGTPTRTTPRNTPRLYGSIHSAAGSYTGKLGGYSTPPTIHSTGLHLNNYDTN